uniref:Protochlorophyllide reductase n=1 Tax=Guillardia theta TaxID=55529 RepID=A0A7S4JA31_GUITH
MATATILLAVAATSCAHAFQPSLLPLTSTRISSSSPFPSSSSSAGYRSIPSRARAWRCSARDDGRRTVEETRVNRREAAVVLSSIVLLPTLTSAAAQDDVKLPLAPPGGPRNIVITGSSSGIGKDAACKLAAGGYNVFLACRTMEKAMEARDSVEEEVKLLASKAGRSPGELTAMECDLSSLSSIKKFADEWNKSGKPIDVLVLNAGVALNTGARPPPPAPRMVSRLPSAPTTWVTSTSRTSCFLLSRSRLLRQESS